MKPPSRPARGGGRRKVLAGVTGAQEGPGGRAPPRRGKRGAAGGGPPPPPAGEAPAEATPDPTADETAVAPVEGEVTEEGVVGVVEVVEEAPATQPEVTVTEVPV